MTSSMGRKISTSRNTSSVITGQAPSRPYTRKTGVASLRGKAVASLNRRPSSIMRGRR